MHNDNPAIFTVETASLRDTLKIAERMGVAMTLVPGWTPRTSKRENI